jgi:hypothetical protein
MSLGADSCLPEPLAIDHLETSLCSIIADYVCVRPYSKTSSSEHGLDASFSQPHICVIALTSLEPWKEALHQKRAALSPSKFHLGFLPDSLHQSRDAGNTRKQDFVET